MTNSESLFRDPLFQLNLSIFLAQRQGDFTIKPILFELGYSLQSIGSKLSLPLAVRSEIKDKAIKANDNAKPEIVLINKRDKKYIFWECKCEFFSTDSSTAAQCRTYLLMTGSSLGQVLGLRNDHGYEGMVVYLTPSDKYEQLEATLMSLKLELEQAGLEVGTPVCLGIQCTDTSLSICFTQRSGNLLGICENGPILIKEFESGTDPRPLYIIPIDPGISQASHERDYCLRVFNERSLNFLIRIIGRAGRSNEVIINYDDLMDDVTLGFYKYWQDNEARRYVRDIINNLLREIAKFINDKLQKNILFRQGQFWQIKAADRQTLDRAREEIMNFSVERLNIPPSTNTDLFENK